MLWQLVIEPEQRDALRGDVAMPSYERLASQRYDQRFYLGRRPV